MKILYDNQIFKMQHFGGVSRYFAELLKANSASLDLHLIPPQFSKNEYLLEIEKYKYLYHLAQVKEKKFPYNTTFSGSNIIKRYFAKFENLLLQQKKVEINEIKKGNFDIFHPTYYNPYFLNALNNKPFVLTVYDMIHEIFSNEFSPNDTTTIQKKIVCEKANKIIAISHSTKNDLIGHFNIASEKIEVIYLSSSLNVLEERKIELPKNYLLFVGGRKGYKNFINFIKSCQALLNSNKDLHIVCTGGFFTNEEIKLFETLNIKDQIIQKFVTDQELIFTYKHALAFIFPSKYEGFGIPVLEAMQCGCPTIISDGGSLPEVGGNASIYFNPNSQEDMKMKIEQVYHNKELRNDLIRKGYQQAKQFSWDKCRAETEQLYKSI